MEKPNIVLVTIDSLRQDFVGVYGERDVETPNMDSIAEEGTYLEDVISNAPYTAASFPAIMFGKLVPNSPKDTYRIEGESIAQVLKEEGYETAGFHSNPYLSPAYGYDKGFERFEDFEGESIELTGFMKSVKERLLNADLLKSILRVPYYYYNQAFGVRPFLEGGHINEVALRWLEEVDNPFFLWIHYMDVHHPYNPSSSEVDFLTRAKVLRKAREDKEITSSEEQILKKLYREKAEEIDDILEPFVERFNEDENTFLIVTSDHGEEFGEHGRFGHGPRLFDETLKVPFLVNRGFPAGESQYSLKNMKDFIISAVEGESKISELQGDKVYITCRNLVGDISVAERLENEKYIVREKRENKFFDLNSDPLEKNNIIEKEFDEEREKRIWDKLDSLSGEKVERDEKVKERLKDLGYRV